MIKVLLAAIALAGDVENLTDANFDDFVKNNKKVLVKFYAPWCGHCKKMAPEWEEAATKLKGKVPLADVDATEQKTCASKYGVSGYPTIKWFVDGEAQEYGGGRTADKIVEWVESMSGEAVQKWDKDVTPTGKPVLILNCPKEDAVFSSFADKNRQAAAFYFKEAAGACKVTLQHQGEDIQEHDFSSPDAEKLNKFFNDNKVPLVGELNGDTYGDYTADESKGLIWCLFKHEDGKLQEAKTENMAFMLKIAKADYPKGRYPVTFTDTVQFAQAIEGMLGVTEFPAVVVQKKAGGKQKFVFPGAELDADKVISFIKDVQEDKIVSKLKSEPVPTEQGDVKVIVGDNLMEMVFNDKKDVLLEVYAPWCGHCKKLEPEYEKLAKKVVKDIDDHVTIAKMDGTANDSPTDDIDWSGFPTIKYIKAGSKKVEAYEGGRTAKEMWTWIRENSSKKDEITKALSEKHADESVHDEL
jgi:protein disulfide isomerase